MRCEKARLPCAYNGSPEKAGPLEWSLSPYSFDDSDAIGALKAFTLQLGPELAGGFSDNIWCHVLPQIAHHEPVIRDGLVAVTMLDASIRRSQSTDAAIRQYNKAIQELRVRLASTESDKHRCQDVVLLACLLFTIFECLHNGILNALQHISGGMKLLMQWESDGTRSGDQALINRADIQPVFLVLDSQAVQMGVIGFRDFASLPAISQSHSPRCTRFQSIEEAHLMMNQIFNRMSRWAHWIEPSTAIGPKPDALWMAMERQRLHMQLVEWDTAFEPLLDSVDNAKRLLLVQRRVIQACFERNDGLSELEWDKHLSTFEEAVQYAEMYMEFDQRSTPTSAASSAGKRSVFIVALDIVLPLFLISAKCRDVTIRRRALALLKQCNRKEG